MSASGVLGSDWRIPNDPFGAFCRDNHCTAEPTGAGLLDGLTCAVKDVMSIAGHRTAFGQPTWYRTHPPGTQTALASQRGGRRPHAAAVTRCRAPASPRRR